MQHFKLWSPDKTRKLVELISSGVTFTTIAEALGITRNAAIGKSKRLGLNKPILVEGVKVHKPRQLKPPTGEGIPFIQLTNYTCRFPLWGDKAKHYEKFYCGATHANMTAGKPYCPWHAKRCSHRGNTG